MSAVEARDASTRMVSRQARQVARAAQLPESEQKDLGILRTDLRTREEGRRAEAWRGH